MFMSDETSELQAKARHTASGVPRREALKIAGALFVTGLTSVPTGSQTRRARKSIVGGAGLCRVFTMTFPAPPPLVKRGHHRARLEGSGGNRGPEGHNGEMTTR